MTRLVTFSTGGKTRPGAVRDGRILDLEAAGLPVGEDGDLLGIARGGDAALGQISQAVAAWSGADGQHRRGRPTAGCVVAGP